MGSFFSEMERIIGANSDRTFEIATHYYGQSFVHSRPPKHDQYASVYGREAGGTYDIITSFTGIVNSDDLTTSDGQYSANFDEGFLYTAYKDVLVGDIVTIDLGPNAKTRVWLVTAFENIGYSTNIFVKYRIANRN